MIMFIIILCIGFIINTTVSPALESNPAPGLEKKKDLYISMSQECAWRITQYAICNNEGQSSEELCISIYERCRSALGAQDESKEEIVALYEILEKTSGSRLYICKIQIIAILLSDAVCEISRAAQHSDQELKIILERRSFIQNLIPNVGLSKDANIITDIITEYIKYIKK